MGNTIEKFELPGEGELRTRSPTRRVLSLVESAGRQGVHEATWSDSGIDLRVDWNGTDEPTFKVYNTDEEWAAMEDDLDTSSSENSVIHQVDCAEPTSFVARFRRGVDGPSAPFRVQAKSITWLVSPEDLDEYLSDPAFFAIRDEHYEYDSENDISYQCSTQSGNHHVLDLDLDPECDYEVWVELEHPSDPNEHLEIDPIVRTGNSGD